MGRGQSAKATRGAATRVQYRDISPPGKGEDALGVFVGREQIGYVSFTPLDPDDSTQGTFIDTLSIWEEHQRQGHGTALMDELCHQRGHDREALGGSFEDDPRPNRWWRKYLGGLSNEPEWIWDED